MQFISIVGLIGISLTIFASLYYAPVEEYTDSYGDIQYHELGNNARYGLLGEVFYEMNILNYMNPYT